jgi:hypothetical protein
MRPKFMGNVLHMGLASNMIDANKEYKASISETNILNSLGDKKQSRW